MAFYKLFGKRLLVIRHTSIKLIFGYIHIINLDVEILPGRKRISLLFDFFIANCHREILYGFLALECTDNLFYLFII